MHKEILIAIVFGSALGLVMAFGVWKANNAIKMTEEQQTTMVETDKKMEDEKPRLDFELLKPIDMSGTTDSPIEVSGVITGADWLVISGEDEDVVLPVSGDSFETMVETIGGLNEIKVSAVAKFPLAQITEGVKLMYTTQLDSSEENEESVDEEVEKMRDRITMYMGAITDITETVIQVRSEDEGIRQISINENTTYANIIKETKEIAFADIAIGDYMMAVGSMDDKSKVLEADRVLISTAFIPTARQILVGEVVEITKQAVKIKTGAGNKDVDITQRYELTKFLEQPQIVKAKLSEITEGTKMVVIGEEKGELIKPRRVHILPI